VSQTSIIRESYSLHFCLLAGNLAGEKFARDFVHCRTASVFLSLGVVLLETSILLLIIWNDSGMLLENLRCRAETMSPLRTFPTSCFSGPDYFG
jgi:hypothetical protein